MYHEEYLEKAGGFHAGRLSPAERAGVERHLATCADCRTVYGKWTLVEPRAGLEARVMARLDEKEEASLAGWSLRLPLWGSVAAAILILAAFWQPERGWIDADKGFAWDGHSRWSPPAVAPGMKGGRP